MRKSLRKELRAQWSTFQAKRVLRAQVFVLIGSAWVSLVASSAFGSHIPTALDQNAVRTVMPNEGYLSFHSVVPFGEERTGWTDTRHPANDGTNFAFMRNHHIGYDRSDKFVQVHNKVTTINRAMGGGGETADPNIPRDYDFANEVWAQAGLSVFSTGIQHVDHSTGNAAGNNVVTSTVNPADRTMIQGQNRTAAPVVNNWYATTGVDNTGGALRGVARAPTANATTHGTMIFDNPANDTFAHELGHFLLDSHQFNNPGDTAHSPMNRDLMASGGAGRVLPGLGTKGDFNTAPRDSGRQNGPNLGTVDHLDAQVRLGAPPPPGISQIQAVHTSAFAQQNFNLSAGDRADFDWVEDNGHLENIPGADIHPALDFLVWSIGPIGAPGHAGHDHDNWRTELTPPLPAGAFTGDSFRVVDVVSQIARYTDMDITAANNWSRRQAALDYLVQFSNNGVNWVDGTPVRVFVRGWTDRAGAEDYIARWTSPVAATHVRIGAKFLDGHDGAAQIDALIASAIPEPSSACLFLVGLAPLLPLCRRQPANHRAA
jgi:hypothetical protein